MIDPFEHDKCKPEDLIEDDTEFDMSPEACQEREELWFRKCLDIDQQLEACRTTFPIPREQMSLHAKYWLFGDDIPAEEWLAGHEEAKTANPDEMDWRELNPKYLNQKTLGHVTALYLPACVTDTRQHQPHLRITTPAWPQFGPFRCKSHKCLPAMGFCITCGLYHGKEFAQKPAYYDANFDWATRVAMSQTVTCEGGSSSKAVEANGHTKQMLLMPLDAIGPQPDPTPFSLEPGDLMDDVDAALPYLDNILPLDGDAAFEEYMSELEQIHSQQFSMPGVGSTPLWIDTSIPFQPMTEEELRSLSTIPTATTGNFWSPGASTPMTGLTDLSSLPDPFLDDAMSTRGQKQGNASQQVFKQSVLAEEDGYGRAQGGPEMMDM